MNENLSYLSLELGIRETQQKIDVSDARSTADYPFNVICAMYLLVETSLGRFVPMKRVGRRFSRLEAMAFLVDLKVQ